MAGWNDWNTSDVVTAAQFQTLVQDQVIMVFADATARDAAVSGADLAEGMHAYLSDTDTLTYYTGAAWANVAPEGTAVLATGVTDGYVLTADGAGASAWAAVATPWTLVGYSATGGTTTSTAAVDLLTISGLSIPVTAPVRIMGNYSKDASAAQIVGVGLKINSTVVIEASNSQNFARSSPTQRAEDGFFDFTFGPRSTSYLGGNGQGTAQTKVSSTGANAQTPYLMGGTLTNLYPNAEITSITLRGINVTASNNLAVKDVFIFQGPTL